MRSTTLLLTAVFLAVAACGTETADDPATSSHDSGADSASDSGAESVDPQPDQAVEGVVAPPTVLASPTSVQAYPSWFSAEPSLYAQVQGAFAAQGSYPSVSQPLLAFRSFCSRSRPIRMVARPIHRTFNGANASFSSVA